MGIKIKTHTPIIKIKVDRYRMLKRRMWQKVLRLARLHYAFFSTLSPFLIAASEIDIVESIEAIIKTKTDLIFIIASIFKLSRFSKSATIY